MAEPETKKKTSSIMPDWSQLPEELLYHISTHLEEENCFDVVHARSVCTLWRSAFPFPSSLLRQSYSLPTFPPSESKELCTYEKFPLFLFRLRAPHANAAEYFMGGIGRDESEEDHLELLPSPLQCSVKVKIPGSDTTSMNMLDCQILSLGHQYRMIGKKLNGLAFLPLDKEEGKRGEFVVLRIYSRGAPLLVLTSEEMRWKPLEIDNTLGSICVDIFICRGRFYAAFLPGQVFSIDPYSLEVTLLLPSPQPVHSLVPFGNDELFLVETTFHNLDVADSKRVSCRASRLDEKTGTWVEVKDLGNRVLIIGGLGNVSFSAKELPLGCGLNGNSILFINQPGGVTSAFKYGEPTEYFEDDVDCWRPSRENRVIVHNKSFPMVAFQAVNASLP
ncbi:PREDICTED: F-box/kelch-repeat protein At1g64840-like [Camelina sativa]|uniref:F-box/kelch-repeat protein At1g64840-like n=1 Tax=Camelina sativa TaxID=90675 RepID=A0ABM0TPN4_CAMSA|nr:PREDICTED: F-box/kelch-repeat protein At1g64840-like [Camelina sativa]XP_019085115.1 PREDICTED: F-box/kelch-repeat protein At1g64840-like [Camelina sativa]